MDLRLLIYNPIKSRPLAVVLLSTAITAVMFILGFYSRQTLLAIGVSLLLIAGIAAGIYCAWLLFKNKLYKDFPRAARQRIVSLFDNAKRFYPARPFQRRARSKALPWFLVIGPTDAGKTALLNQSDLHFSEPAGSGNADFSLKFAEEAVFIDSKGSSLLSLEASGSWQRLQKELKRIHKRHGLKGVLLILSYEWMMDEANLYTNISEIQKRIAELYHRLGSCIPVYILISKCEQIEGFSQFFSSLNANARKQIWGIDLFGAGQSECKLEQNIDALEKKLAIRQLNQLHVPASLEDKIAVLRFPQYFYQFSTLLIKAIKLLSRDSIYQEKLNLQGIYFTGAIKEGSQVSSYFIHDFLQKKLFNDEPKPVYTRRRCKLRAWRRLGQMMLLLVLLLGGLSLLTKAYLTTSRLLKYGNDLARKGSEFLTQNTGQYVKLAFLIKAANHVEQLRNFDKKHSWYQTFGMNRFASQLELCEMLLARMMDKDFYKPAKYFLERSLNEFHQQWQKGDSKERENLRGSYYAALKLYLMLYFPQQMEIEFARDELADIWKNMKELHFEEQGQDFDGLKLLSRIFLENLFCPSSDKQCRLTDYQSDLIQAARNDLSANGISNIFSLIEMQGLKALGYTNLAALLEANDDTWHSEYKLPVFYTLKGFKQFVKPAFREYARFNANQDWVIHMALTGPGYSSFVVKNTSDEKQKKFILSGLYSLYLSKYLHAWLQLIGSIQISPYSTFENAHQQLQAMEQIPGPISQLFAVFNQNINLQKMLNAEEIDHVPVRIRQQMKEIGSLAGSGQGLLVKYTKQLAALQEDMKRMAMSSDPGNDSLNYAAGLCSNQGRDTELFKTFAVIEDLTNQISSLEARQVFKKLLLRPVKESFQVVLDETQQKLQFVWQQTVLQVYQQQLATRFPFNHQGKDVDLSSFNAFFMPKQGVFAQFMAILEPFLRQQGAGYASNQWLGMGLTFSPSFLAAIAKIQNVSRSLFPHGDSDLALHYAIYPIPTPGLKEILIAVNGQTYPYRNGPQEWITFLWPGQDSMENETFIRITDTFSDAQAVKEFQGTWGFFHLLQEAQRISKTPEGYRAEWLFEYDGDARKVRMLIVPKTAADPFAALLFNPLHLPQSIMGNVGAIDLS